jgi:hypothetical protein
MPRLVLRFQGFRNSLFSNMAKDKKAKQAEKKARVAQKTNKKEKQKEKKAKGKPKDKDEEEDDVDLDAVLEEFARQVSVMLLMVAEFSFVSGADTMLIIASSIP